MHQYQAALDVNDSMYSNQRAMNWLMGMLLLWMNYMNCDLNKMM